MPISFGRPKDEDVVSLIAARNYARAIELLKEQLRRRGANPSLRMQLADVLILADKKSEAIALLLPLADEYANEGFAAKAVSVLKKIQRIDPRRRDVDARLARLIQEKQREAISPARSAALAAPAAAGDEPGLEIGFEGIAPVSAPVPAADASSFLAGFSDADPNQTLPVDSLPVGALPGGALPVAPHAPQPPSHARSAEASTPAAASRAFAPGPESRAPAREEEPELLPDLKPLPGYGSGGESLPSLDLGDAAPIEDNDLLYLGDGEAEEPETVEAELVPEPAEPMSAGQFADELMALVDNLFQEPAPPARAAAAKERAPAQEAPAAQIVVSPLFRDFSVDEMVAVIAGLKLLSFGRGDVILREGDPGTSLFMLTSGRVRAFKKDARGEKQRPLGDLHEGAFFGELSILTGRPRTASVVALSRCELLELDRATLDEITQAHPHVWDVLREFAAQRAAPAPR